MSPAVSVMTPAFNREATLEATVRSVLGQSVTDLEIIVVDDGSATEVASVVGHIEDPRLRIVRHAANRGLSAARNTALAHARAPLVSQLDSDDTWEPEYLARVLPAFEDPRVGLAYTEAFVVGDPARTRYLDRAMRHPPERVADLLPDCPIPNPTVTMRRAAVGAAGGYSGTLWSTQDWRLYLELAARGWRFACIDEPLATYRWADASSMSSDLDRVRADIVRMHGHFLLSHPSALPAYRKVAPALARGLVRRLRGASRTTP